MSNQAPVVAESHPGLPFPRRAFAVLAVSTGNMMLMIDVSIANIVLPSLSAELQVDSSDAVLVVTIYQLILAMALMPMAAFGERIGLRRLYSGGLVLHSIAAFFCFHADSLESLLLARSLQAVGTAASLSVAFGLLRAIYPLEHLGKGMAINTIANAGGTALAPVVGGLVLSTLSWHWVFAAAVPFSILSLAFSRALPDPEPHSQPFDGRGAALCAATFGLVVIGLQLTTHGMGVWIPAATLLLGGLVAWVFVSYERRVERPILPVELLAIPKLAVALLANFSAVIGSMIILVFVPFMLQQNLGFSPASVGGMMASYALASVMVAPVSGYLSDHIPVTRLCVAGMLVSTIGLVLLATLPETSGRSDIAWRMWLCGAGFGMFFSPNARLIIGAAPKRLAASTGSMVTTVRMLGQALGATLTAGMLALGLGDSGTPLFVAAALVAFAGICKVLKVSA
ncbi:MFS transporter [Haliea sp. E17]|uniref:MFS transporter n=1 Tax=Haliea sp. E17 TaxID=3401576 RepID=UPI003AAA5D1A